MHRAKPKLSRSPISIRSRFDSCPGPQREVEVLHDQLLHLFTALPDLRPSEVRIMTPDIERYAPHIEAIFDMAGTRIPYGIAGRAHLAGSPLVEAFLRLLEVARGRCTAADILDLLDAPPILARRDFTEPDITVIRRWVREARIRWGVDAGHLHGLGLPAFPDNTWKAGIDRLVIVRGESRRPGRRAQTLEVAATHLYSKAAQPSDRDKTR